MVLTRAGRASGIEGWITVLLDATAVEVLPGFCPDASLCRCLSSLSCSICARPVKTEGNAAGTGANVVSAAFGTSPSSSDSDPGLTVTRAGGWSFIEAANALHVRDEWVCRVRGPLTRLTSAVHPLVSVHAVVALVLLILLPTWRSLYGVPLRLHCSLRRVHLLAIDRGALERIEPVLCILVSFIEGFYYTAELTEQFHHPRRHVYLDQQCWIG